MPCPSEDECNELLQLGPLFEALTEDQDRRVQQIMDSRGFKKHGLPVSEVRRIIRHVRSNWP